VSAVFVCASAASTNAAPVVPTLTASACCAAVWAVVTVVPVARVPNVPLADVVVAELRENGIEAFYKVLGVGGIVAASSVTTPGNQCEVYVQRADAQRAQSLLPK